MIAALVAGGVATLFLVAAVLEPDPRGHGTHQQLGLGPCTFARWVHVRCPSCGMTTAWCHAAHGDLVTAVNTHVTGTLLALATLGVGLVSLFVALTGQRFRLLSSDRQYVWLAVIAIGSVMLEWGCRLGCERWFAS